MTRWLTLITAFIIPPFGPVYCGLNNGVALILSLIKKKRNNNSVPRNAKEIFVLGIVIGGVFLYKCASLYILSIDNHILPHYSSYTGRKGSQTPMGRGSGHTRTSSSYRTPYNGSVSSKLPGSRRTPYTTSSNTPGPTPRPAESSTLVGKLM